jgi:hypothetical protein
MQISEAQKIEKKLRQIESLYLFSFEIKKHQLKKKYPNLSDRELNRMINEMIQRGCA